MFREPRVNLRGNVFGRLTVTAFVGWDKHKHPLWLCRCDCGNTVTVKGCHLKCNHTKSCGCLRNELVGERYRTHGERHTRIYRIWLNMKSRCYIPKSSAFKHYGGRGIRVCDDWQKYEAFRDWAMANGYRDDLTLDRIDVNGNYSPDNCRWATFTEQANNTRKTILIEYGGVVRSLHDWSRLTGVNYYTMYSRYKAGKTPAEIIGKDVAI